MKSRRIFMALALCITILAGCSDDTKDKSKPGNAAETSTTENSKGKEADAKSIKLVKKAEKAEYLLTNGIEILSPERNIDDKGDRKINIIQISGLVDKAVEEKINRDIEKEILDIARREINKPVKGEWDYINIFCSAALNANNILSVNISMDNGPIESIPIRGLLYRLTDGRKLQLKDIFTEGTDYVALINRKVTERILVEGIEEEHLSEPFITISPLQNFILTNDSLGIIFSEGEGGFVDKYCIRIPLSEIDGYVDVLERYGGSENVRYEKSKLMIRENNIFIGYKNEIIPVGNGDIWASYNTVSGLGDDAFEGLINNQVKTAINEVVQNSRIKALRKSEFKDRPVALVNINTTLNRYGVIILRRTVYSESENKGFNDLGGIYSFNLKSKKPIDCESLLEKYFSENKSAKDNLIGAVKEKLKNNNPASMSSEFAREIDSRVNYTFIKDKGVISFSGYGEELSINIDFDNDAFHSDSLFLNVAIPFESIIKVTPEDFFGTR